MTAPQGNLLLLEAVSVAKYTQPRATIYNGYFTAHPAEESKTVWDRERDSLSDRQTERGRVFGREQEKETD